MKIAALLGSGQRSLSYEFSPPKDEVGATRLLEAARQLRQHAPSFVSVTYGAGGSTRARTFDWIARLRDEGLEAMPHLTCVGATESEIGAVCEQLTRLGVQNLLALRGDPPRGEDQFRPSHGGFAHAVDLIRFVRQNFDFCLGAACYPERHPESNSSELDLAYLKDKVEAGADFLITQFFYQIDDFRAFLSAARHAGIRAPLLPGVLPATDLDAVLRMARRCGARIADELRLRLGALSHDAAAQTRAGLEVTRLLCEQLLASDVAGLHFYTRNQSHDTEAVLAALPRAWRDSAGELFGLAGVA